MNCFGTVLILLALLVPTYARAQEARHLNDGDRVRVTAPGHDPRRFVGTVRMLRGDTLTLDSLSIPLASVTRLEVSAGSKSHWLTGMGIGLIVGGTIGGIIGANQEDCSGCTLPGAVLVGAGGVVVGLLTGLAIRTERWGDVDVDRLRVPTGAGTHLQFGVSLSF